MKIKNLLACLSTALLTAVNASGQGQILFYNGSTSVVQIYTPTGYVSAPSSIYGTRLQLYYSTASLSPVASSIANGFSLDGWTAIGKLGTNIASNGRYGDPSAITIPNSVGVSIWLEAVAWSGDAGGSATTFATLSSALADPSVLVGSSGVWQQLTGNPNLTPPQTPVKTDRYMNALGNMQMGLLPSPEPTSVSLICLGAASVFMFRRKKS